jgi:hypothetical protein
MASSSDNDHELAAILNSHKAEGSQDSDLPAWIQAHVSTSAGAAYQIRKQGPDALQDALATKYKPIAWTSKLNSTFGVLFVLCRPQSRSR